MSHHVAQPDTAGRGKLWFGLLGGAIAWLAHLLLSWIVGEFGCLAGLGEITLLGLAGTAWLVILVSLATFAVSVAAAVAARAVGKRLRPEADSLDQTGSDRFLARIGVITSGLFAFVILVESIPVFFFLRSCY